MADPLLDQMTRLRLKLLEKRVSTERDRIGRRTGTAPSAWSFDDHKDALYNALRRKNDLLQELKEQHLFEDLSHPHTWGGANRWHRGDYLPTSLPIHFYQPPPAVPLPPQTPPQAPRILQQTVPQQPTTIIQQLPQQQPLITQIPPPQPFPASKSGSIKEDMVELMLMQNAQMHQIIMHNMMLKAIPPMTFSSAGGASQATPTHQSTAHQEKYQGAPVIHRVEKSRGSSVHHHHHYSPAAAAPLPLTGYAMWPQVMASAGQEVSSQPRQTGSTPESHWVSHRKVC